MYAFRRYDDALAFAQIGGRDAPRYAGGFWWVPG